MSTDMASAVTEIDIPNAEKTLDTGALIGALSSGTTDPVSLILSQLNAQAPDNPALAVLGRLLEQRRSLAEAESEKDSADDDVSRRAEIDQERARCMQDLRDAVEKAYAELEMLRERNDALAAALGACFVCFGNDPGCQECGGRGVPGSRPPEPAAYREFVLPAMHRVWMMQAGPTGRPPRKPPLPIAVFPGGPRVAKAEVRSWRLPETAPSAARPATVSKCGVHDERDL